MRKTFFGRKKAMERETFYENVITKFTQKENRVPVQMKYSSTVTNQ